MNASPNRKINADQIKEFFDQAIQQHGATPQGVHWNSVRAQVLRFDQLVKLIDHSAEFSLNDWGCGYGALVGYMEGKGWRFQYNGYDLLPSMVARARELYAGRANCRFVEQEGELLQADYTVASGVFNAKLDTSDDDWREYILRILHRMDFISRRGFSFNMLTRYSDPEYMRSELYYGDPCFFFDYCKRHFSRQVALLHDYELFDYTILVRKA